MKKADLPTRAQRFRDRPAVAFVLTFFERFGRHQVSIYAASMAYYTVLSIFPLLLFLLFIGSFFLETERVQSFVFQVMQGLLPFAADALQENIASVLRYRGTLGTLSALGTLWSASGMFSALERAVNAVWDRCSRRSYWEQRLLGILSLLGMTAWILFTLWARTLVRLLPYWFPVLEKLPAAISPWTERAISLFSMTLLNIIIYLFFPRATIRRRLAVGLGLIVGILWLCTREFFSWALAVGVLKYPLVYGSLWVLIVPIIWAYWSYLLLLSGAEMQAYLEERRWLSEA